MTMIPQPMDTAATQATHSERGGVVPPGYYDVYIKRADVGPTKKNDGLILTNEYEIFAPEMQRGRQLYDRLNLRNPSQMAEQIAWGAFNAICKVVGLPGQVQDSSQIVTKCMRVKVDVDQSQEKNADGSYKYGPQNRIVNYEPYVAGAPFPSGNAAPATAPNGAAPQSAHPAAQPQPYAAPAATPAPAYPAAAPAGTPPYSPAPSAPAGNNLAPWQR